MKLQLCLQSYLSFHLPYRPAKVITVVQNYFFFTDISANGHFKRHQTSNHISPSIPTPIIALWNEVTIVHTLIKMNTFFQLFGLWLNSVMLYPLLYRYSEKKRKQNCSPGLFLLLIISFYDSEKSFNDRGHVELKKKIKRGNPCIINMKAQLNTQGPLLWI